MKRIEPVTMSTKKAVSGFEPSSPRFTSTFDAAKNREERSPRTAGIAVVVVDIVCFSVSYLYSLVNQMRKNAPKARAR